MGIYARHGDIASPMLTQLIAVPLSSRMRRFVATCPRFIPFLFEFGAPRGNEAVKPDDVFEIGST